MTSHNPYPIPRRYLDGARSPAAATIDPRLRIWARDAEDASGAILVGTTGVGKTLAAAVRAAQVELCTSSTWVKWIRADELSRLLSDRNGSEQVQMIKQARLLVIDELGYERFPELALEVLGSRHDNSRPTIVTSGLKLPELAARYSDATVRRIIEIGDGCVVDCWEKATREQIAAADESKQTVKHAAVCAPRQLAANPRVAAMLAEEELRRAAP